MRLINQRTPSLLTAAILFAASSIITAQTAATPPAEAKTITYSPIPGFDPTSLDTTAGPCNDFYKFACGRYAANHPIPPDEGAMGPGQILGNVNTQWLRGILDEAASGGATRSPDEQKIGDFYAACLDTALIEQKNLAPIQPMLDEIDGLGNGLRGKFGLPPLIGKLQRAGVGVFFNYGEQQDFKDASKQIAIVGQGGLGLPEKDYYLRTGAKDIEIRQQYEAHIAKMLTLSGTAPDTAKKDAAAILAFETSLAKASLGVTEMRDPEKIYHLESTDKFESRISPVNFGQFLDAVHSPRVAELNDATPEFFPALVQLVKAADMQTLKAYMRFPCSARPPATCPNASTKSRSISTAASSTASPNRDRAGSAAPAPSTARSARRSARSTSSSISLPKAKRRCSIS